LHRSKSQFEENGFQIILVGLGTFDQAEAFKKRFSLSFPIICDPEKKLYRTYGLGRGSVASIVSPAFLFKGLKTVSRGHMLGPPQGDIMQMPGVFLIDTSGNIRYAYYSKDPSDNPSIDALLALKNVFQENRSQVSQE
jgi:peroxiredoxin